MNSRRLLVSLLAVALGSPSVWAHSITYVVSESNGKKQIVFESHTTAESMEGTAERLSGTVSLDPAVPGLALRASLTVPVASMTTGLQMRDEHMMNDEWLDEPHYPTIRFDLTGAQSKAIARGANTWFVNATGQFTLKGISRTIRVPTTIHRQKIGTQDGIVLEGRFPVPLSEHHIHGPVAMQMVGLKVAPEVQVSFKIVGVADPAWNGGGWPAVPKKNPTQKKLY